ncbi:MAG TPA: nucleotidyltransferase family protein [Steroidobacteraceae bacterium]|nr:nucleotidyltransferase family protein [Steroidobacteraceae bacterium]
MRPSPETIQRALTQATERFAAELAEPTPQAPSWNDFEWSIARAAAVLHGVTPLLSSTLRWTGPQSWQAFLMQQRQQTLLRYERIAAVLRQITDQAAAQGLAFVALKGSALHALGVYTAGERPMADIDLLVRPADAARAAQVLAAVGYVQTGAVWKHEIFEPAQCAGPANPYKGILASLPLGEHEAYPVKVELHTRIVERLPLAEAEITELVFPAGATPGLNPYRSNSALLLHLLLHAAGNLATRSMRLMHLHDLARLAAPMTTPQWEELLGLGSTPKSFWWAFPPLQMLNHYQPGLVPQAVINTVRQACPWTLRRLSHHATLTQFSLASLSIPAFPAMAWCTSTGERLRYVGQRVRPTPATLAMRAVVADEQWAAQSTWWCRSQGLRMLQWLFARPPRQAPMYIVRLALQNPA